MLWKFLLSLVPVFYSSSVDIENLQLPSHFPLYDHGPQTLEEEEQAYKALYSEDDVTFPKDFMRGGIKDTKYRWPGYPGGAEIPYVIDESLDSQKEMILEAMEQYNKTTCIKFVPRKNESDYINIIYESNRCSSILGRKGGEQKIKLGKGCHYIGTIVHELGHAIGLYHEHQRFDRDDFLVIHKENIKPGKEGNFFKYPEFLELILTPFNCDSIMIYGNYAFSKQPKHLKTVEAKNGVPLIPPHVKPGLHSIDIMQVNKLYKCK